VHFGLKRGKLLYVFKYPTHDVERDKHRNVVTRARFIKDQLETAGYRLIPWDFKKGQPPKFWAEEGTMEEEDDDLYGPAETAAPAAAPAKTEDVKNDDDASSGDEPMDEGLESGEEDESESDSVRMRRVADTQLS
jgi:pre-mRNA 3'-end-processing factor FIP1